VNNHVHRSARGVVSTGSVGLAIVGNLIRAIHQRDANPASTNDGYAIVLRASRDVAVVSNTLWDVDGGLSQRGNTQATVVNNIIGGIGPAGGHLSVESVSVARGSRYQNNVLAGKVRILRAGRILSSIDGLVEQENHRARGEAGDPQFVGGNPPGAFRLKPGSRGIDAGYDQGGAPAAVFQAFVEQYPNAGTIARDLAGTRRPQRGADWDVGAYETVPTVSRPKPR
jgi:hypothetical protein